MPASRILSAILAAAALALAAFAAYHASLPAPFTFDDRPAIERNETLRQLWPLSVPLSPPVTAAGAAGRPLVNLSLALNHAAGGLEPAGYRLTNILLHALAAGLLLLLTRETLRHTRHRGCATPLATATALLWLLHPLQTESVVCVVQRNEILVAIFYLLTLLAVARAAVSSRPAAWKATAAAAALLGVLSKEVMATAPLVALLYDRCFLSATWREVWQRRLWLHAALVATWIPLAWLMLGHDQRAGTVGFGLGVGTWSYLLTQCDALTTYLRLTFWPYPLLVDRGVGLAGSIGEVWPQGILVLTLLATAVFALWRAPRVGFAAAAFFIILAPSSSFVPLTTQPVAEHRMYLPLAQLLALGVIGAGLILTRGRVVALVLAALAAGFATHRRTLDYLTEESLWTQTLHHLPENPRAHASLGHAHARAGRWEHAVASYREAVRLRPDYADAHNDLGAALGRLGRTAEALGHHRRAAELKPDDAEVRYNLAVALEAAGRPAEAIPHLRTVTATRPELAPARALLGTLLLRGGDRGGALPELEAAVALRPDDPELRVILGDALQAAGRPRDAATHYARAAELRPDVAELRYNLGNLQLESGETPAAVA
ncbi:MAG: tetratricopeptide repeat protein, partial [Opitutaceae bacterium]